MFGMSPMELLLVGGIVIVLFGAKKLPGVGEGMGRMIHNFKKQTAEPPKEGERKPEE